MPKLNLVGRHIKFPPKWYRIYQIVFSACRCGGNPASNFTTGRSCKIQSNALDKSVRIASKTFLLFILLFSIFLSLVKCNAGCQRLFENHIGSLIKCYQNNLKVVYRSSFQIFCHHLAEHLLVYKYIFAFWTYSQQG